MATVINDKLPEFKQSLYDVLDDALKEASRDVIIDAKDKAPFLHGDLRANSEVKRVSRLKWRTSFFAEYARFQEFGGDEKRKVKNYTWSGVGPHFLRNAGDKKVSDLKHLFKKHGLRARP